MRNDETEQMRIVTRITPIIDEKSTLHKVISILTKNAPGIL